MRFDNLKVQGYSYPMLKILSDEPAPPHPADAALLPVFSLTPPAVAHVRRLLAEEQKSKAVTALRVGVRGGGCSGLQYYMEFDAETDDRDLVLTFDNLTVFLDKKSAQILHGTVLDFSSGIRASGFHWRNPNEKKHCGCGESFSI